MIANWVVMSGRSHGGLRLRGRDGNTSIARSRMQSLVILLAGTMAGILFLLSLHRSSFFYHETLDWTVTKRVIEENVVGKKGEQEKEDAEDAKERMDKEGHLEGLALGDAATSNEEEEEDKDSILQVTLKSLPVCDRRYTELVPCLDRNLNHQMKLKLNLSLMEHYERRCPPADHRLNCLIPPPPNYKVPIKWPKSKDEIWQANTHFPRR